MAENIFVFEGNAETIITYMFFITAFIFIALVTASAIAKFKTRTLVWYLLFVMFTAAFSAGELLVILTENTYLQKFTYSTITGCWFISWLFFFSSSTKTHTQPVLIISTISFEITITVMVWCPFPEIALIAISIGSYILPIVVSLLYLYWAAITYSDAPWFARTPARMLLLAGALLAIINVFFLYIPYEIIIPLITVFSLLVAGVIFKHPGIFSFLPYKARFLVLLNKKGDVIFEQSWTAQKSILPEKLEEARRSLIAMIRQFDQLVMGTRVGEEGIDLEIEGAVILINTGSRHFNAGLMANRSSRALRDGFSLFLRKVDEIKDNAGVQEIGDISIPIMALLKARMLNISAL